jgi:serine/threonine-protein kinase
MAKAPADRYATTIELANAARDAIGVTVPEPTTSLPATEQAPLPPKQAGNRVTAQPQMSTAESLVSAKPASPRRTPPTPTKDGETRRRTKVALIVGAVVILAAVVVPLYAVFKHQSPQTSPLVASSALPGLLLSPDQIAAVNGATGLKVTGTWQTIQDHSADVPNLGCLALYYPGEKAVYSDSGWTNVEIQQLEEHDSRSNGYKYYVIQAAVLFPAASQTLAFFTTSAQQWSSCSNRQIANTLGATDVVYDVGPLSNNDRTLSITAFQENSHGWACQRALTRANNVAIDIKACSYSPANSAVAIAEQIAAKVPLASKNQDTVASSTASGNSPTSAVTTSRPPRPQRVRPPPMIGTSLHAETAALQ